MARRPGSLMLAREPLRQAWDGDLVLAMLPTLDHGDQAITSDHGGSIGPLGPAQCRVHTNPGPEPLDMNPGSSLNQGDRPGCNPPGPGSRAEPSTGTTRHYPAELPTRTTKAVIVARSASDPVGWADGPREMPRRALPSKRMTRRRAAEPCRASAGNHHGPPTTRKPGQGRAFSPKRDRPKRNRPKALRPPGCGSPTDRPARSTWSRPSRC